MDVTQVNQLQKVEYHHIRDEIVSGITATMASVAKLNPLSFCNGSVLNIRLNPEAVSSDEKSKETGDTGKDVSQDGRISGTV